VEHVVNVRVVNVFLALYSPLPLSTGEEGTTRIMRRSRLALSEDQPMSDQPLRSHLAQQLADIRAKGLFKRERLLQTPQGAAIRVNDRDVVNFCANNYLGLANHPAIVESAHEGLRLHGYGMASVRFICGTQDVHKQLESAIARFLVKDDAILYSSCWDANGGLFETILGEDDAVISDELNHASIIDGIRLCKAKRWRYKNCDIGDLERCLKEAAGSRFKLIATDGVFSMDGSMAPLPEICTLADKYDAAVMVDDSHATGIMGPSGRGTAEHLGVLKRIDIITSTLGKTLGGAAGGFTCARQEIVDYLRQRSRPYLFSNAVPPPIIQAALKALDLVGASSELRDRLHANARWLRQALEKAGFTLKPGQHPILPVMIGDAALASALADKLLERGIYVIGFSYPVVPQGQARIRIQLSAAHTQEQLERAARAFIEVGKEVGLLKSA
jgi:glycine C-acetyltransferase